MARILVVAERVRGRLDEGAWELLSAARGLAGEGGAVHAALCGAGLDAAAGELARGFDAVHVFDDPRLAVPDGEADGLALAALCERERFDLVLLTHGNGTIDLAPALSVRLGAPLLADCQSLEWRDGTLVALRAVHGGKVHARVVATPGAGGLMATVRGGAFPAATPAQRAIGAVRAEALPADFAPRRRTVRTLEPKAGAVDISAAERLVAVGRGFEDEERLELARSLARALGAEVCASRPIVDKGWLPKACQVGTSGVSVKPRLYIAAGISGSFQHMGGIKGGPYLVAINKDPAAPIFGVADVGIVGDLEEVLPALEEAVRAARG